MNNDQKTKALLNLLDEVIRMDEKRTPGKWNHNQGENMSHWISSSMSTVAVIPTDSVYCASRCSQNASFIASASISHGRNARIVKCEIEFWQSILSSKETEVLHEAANIRIEQFLSLYPDDLLKKYLK